MCGIAGFTDWMRPIAVGTADAMIATQVPRGPDATGVWVHDHVALAHARLAVIDIAGGAQPMVATGRSGQPVALTFSGEIYNYRELRAELAGHGHVFRTQSDTEVVLRAYLHWGPGCATHLVGMFAFAVWDASEQQLVLVRDRIGVKPLYHYRTRSGNLVFGSEIKALLAHPEVPAELDETGIAELFALAPNTAPGSAVLRGVEELEPGSLLVHGVGSTTTHSYWTLTPTRHTDDEPTTIATVRELLDQAVASQLHADVPVASLLSGGLDSSLVAAIAAPLQRARGLDLPTFAVDYASDGVAYSSSALHLDRDTPYAEAVARHIGATHTTYYVTLDEMIAAHDQALAAMDLPSVTPLNLSLLLLFRRVRQDAPVVLSGESADEWFGGYAWHQIPQGEDGFPWQHTYRPTWHLLREEVRHAVDPQKYLAERHRQALDAVPHLDGDTSRDRRIRATYDLIRQYYLRFLLHRKDRMSMANGVEVRVPFCDHRLVEYVWSIPWQLKGTGGMEKGVLRKAGADLLPPEVAWRRKSGYPAALSADYQGYLDARMREVLHQPNAPLWQLADRTAVTAMLSTTGDLSDWTALMHVAFLLELDTWLTRYGVRVL